MATASAHIIPSDEKADCFRLLSLIIDGGTTVLRYRFDQCIPPNNLQNKLNDTTIRGKLNYLRRKKVLTPEQWDLLYPAFGLPDSADFDVSLLTCLLRHICGLDEQSPMWTCIPPSFDISIEADITRLRQYRNEVSHMKSTHMTKQDFQQRWTTLEQVILRLGNGIPNLSGELEKLKEDTIDPSKEKELREKIKEWDDMDRAEMDKVKDRIGEIDHEMDQMKDSMVIQNQRVTEIDKEIIYQRETLDSVMKDQSETFSRISDIETETAKHENKISNLDQRQSQLETAIQDDSKKLTMKCKEIDDRLDRNEMKTKKIESEVLEIKSEEHDLSMDKSPVQSSRLQHMASVRSLYTEDPALDEVYVRTHAYDMAERKLRRFGCVILTGLPGEGKTMMASKLLSEITMVGGCLKLKEPSDWDNLDLKKELPLTIFIDDIFGMGALNEELLEGWSRRLPDIEKAIKAKAVKVIITTRHYILMEAKEKMRKMTLFKDENIQLLASFELTDKEKASMLERHLIDAKRQFSSDLFQECCIKYEIASTDTFLRDNVPSEFNDYFAREGSQRVKAMIGFPEIVSLFVRNDHLFKKGASFFEHPFLFFKKCMEELFIDEEKFLALILLWTRPEKSLEQTEVEPPDISDDLKATAKKFGICLEGKSTSILRKSLKYHKDGFLHFSSYSGTYSFCHNTVKDMVGLVAGQEYTGAVLEFADAEFMTQFVTTDERKNDGLHIYIEQYMYSKLHKAICRILVPEALLISEEFTIGDKKIQKRFGFVGVRLSTENEIAINTSSLKHDCFKNRAFVNIFCKSEEANYFFSKPVDVLPQKCIDWNCDINFGKNIAVYFPSLGLLYKTELLLMDFLKHRLDKCIDRAQFLQTNLLIASREGLIEVVKKLLQVGVTMSEEAIYFAAAKGHEECLKYLLQNYAGDSNTCSNSMNKNSPLIAASKIGAVQCMLYLIRHGADVNYRNKNGWSALDKAILYAQPESCKTLLENKAHVNYKTGKFKRTPLHMNADIGEESITTLLLQYGASLYEKDHRGHYPIHCAAFSGNNKIADILLKADVSKKTLKHRISYGKTSVIKGADLFHIAVYKMNVGLLNILLQNNINPNTRDFYGRTPVYRAVYESRTENDNDRLADLLEQMRIMRQENSGVECEKTEQAPHIKIIKILLGKADVNLAERNGYTPLHAAVHRSQTEIVKLLAPVANVNAQDKYGKSPLHTACEQIDFEIFKFLVEDCNADFRIRTRSGQSIFDILDNKTAWRNIRRRYRTRKPVTYYMREYPPYKSFRDIISAKDSDFANINIKGEKENDNQD